MLCKVNEAVCGYQSYRYTSFGLFKGGGDNLCVLILDLVLIDVSDGNAEWFDILSAYDMV